MASGLEQVSFAARAAVSVGNALVLVCVVRSLWRGLLIHRAWCIAAITPTPVVVAHIDQ